MIIQSVPDEYGFDVVVKSFGIELEFVEVVCAVLNELIVVGYVAFGVVFCVVVGGVVVG